MSGRAFLCAASGKVQKERPKAGLRMSLRILGGQQLLASKRANSLASQKLSFKAIQTDIADFIAIGHVNMLDGRIILI